MFAPAVVDVFAGLGGWSIGAEQAFVEGGYRDRYIDLMINHWDVAVGVHQANHPLTEHLRANVLEVDPDQVLLGRRLAYAHFSPDCTDHSKAKGGKPRRKEIRALADVVIVWAGKRRPDVITLENVEEFRQWGPLLPNCQPDPTKRGEEFNRWKRELEALGYVVEFRELRACDYGDPTTRKRLFVVARCDGKPIVWPEATHAKLEEISSRSDAHYANRRLAPECDRPGGLESMEGVSFRSRRNAGRRIPRRSKLPLKPYRTAAECIDWNTPMLSIFASRPEAREWSASLNVGREKHERVGVPQRPLKLNTQKRLAGGLWKQVLNHAKPFIVRVAHGDVGNNGSRRWGNPTHSVEEPLPTVAGSKDFAVADVELAAMVARTDMKKSNAGCMYHPDDPLTTITTAQGHAAVGVELASFASTLNHRGDGDRDADLRKPLHTVTGANDARALIGATIAPFTAGVGGRAGQSGPTSCDAPLPTITGKADRVVGGVQLSAFTVPRYGERDGQQPRCGSVDAPLPTVTATDNGAMLAGVSLIKNYSGVIGQAVDEPIGTVTGIDHHSLLAVHLTQYHNDGSPRSQSTTEPIKTLDTQNRFGLVAAHVVKFRGDSTGTPIDQPMPTVTSGQGAARDAGAAHALGIGAIYLSKMYGTNQGGGGNVGDPHGTVSAQGNHSSLCAIYLTPYYGSGSAENGHSPADPMPTQTGKPRFGLAAVETVRHWLLTPAALKRARRVANWARRLLGKKVEKFLLTVRDETGSMFHLLTANVSGAVHLVTDILMRMLKPRELARAQGFDDSYIIDRMADGTRVCKADQVKLIGNSVCRGVAKAIVKANVVDCGVLDERPARREAVSA